jgi:predicted GH43/DUF377 family glycosyl hydrolase
MNEFKMHRIGIIMEPEKDNPLEVEGVLNPAAVRGPDGELYLFPRIVAKGNFSRIGICKVKFDEAGDPIGVERLGIALEPEMDYELRPNGGGGCEDPRITYVEPLEHYVMAYTAYGPNGARIALARTKNLFQWERMGLVTFSPYRGIEFEGVYNKDAAVFPYAIPNPAKHKGMALLHRPLFKGTLPKDTVKQAHDPIDHTRHVDLEHESIWMSYCSLDLDEKKYNHFGKFTSHHRLASPVEPWENLKIGGGAPPILTKHGWLVIYHGVSEATVHNGFQMCYSAGVMVLNEKHPQFIEYRSAHPVLTPETDHERIGVVDDVVFPTGIDRRDDLDMPDRIDVYYGMADKSIGVARLNVPDVLPSVSRRDAPLEQISSQ